MSSPVIVVGAGGHARVVIDVLRMTGRSVLGCIAKGTVGDLPSGIAYLGDDDALAKHAVGEVDLANGVGSTGATALRRTLYQRFSARGYRFASFVHPAAVVASDVVLGAGAQVMAGAIVQPGTRVGANCIINSGAVVDHDCDLGAHCHVAPGAVLSGGVSLGEGVHVGTGAAVKQGVEIGDGAVVAVGAAVMAAVDAGFTVGGVPARQLSAATG